MATASGTVTAGGEMSVWGGKSDISSLAGVLRRMTVGMRGLGVTLRPLSGCWSDVVTAEGAVEMPCAGFETLSRVLVVKSGSQRAAAKKRRGTTIALTTPAATGLNG